jgi:calnexin
VIDVIVNATKDKPWLWAVYLLVVLVPVVLTIVFCCGKSSKSDSVGDAKKTDAETKDDQEATGQDENEEGGEEVEEETAENVQPVSKSDLEEEEAQPEVYKISYCKFFTFY